MAKLAMGSKVCRVALDVSEKLREIGGDGPWKVRIDRVLEAIPQWKREHAARNRIRHLIKLDQSPSPEQVDQVRAAYAWHCARRMRETQLDDQRRAAEIISFINYARTCDEAFFAAEIDRLCAVLDELRARG